VTGKLSDEDLSQRLWKAGEMFSDDAETELGQRVIEIMRGDLAKACLLMEVAVAVKDREQPRPPERP
jgi:hypothetical protein